MGKNSDKKHKNFIISTLTDNKKIPSATKSRGEAIYLSCLSKRILLLCMVKKMTIIARLNAINPDHSQMSTSSPVFNEP